MLIKEIDIQPIQLSASMVINDSKSYLKIADITTNKSLQPVIYERHMIDDWTIIGFFRSILFLTLNVTPKYYHYNGNCIKIQIYNQYVKVFPLHNLINLLMLR